MKEKKYSILFWFAFVLVILFTTCDNENRTIAKNGYGKISISFAGHETLSQQARTAFPTTVFDKYIYTFIKEGETNGVEISPDHDGIFTLEVGNYTVEVRTYIGNAEPYTLVASGISELFSVGFGDNDPVKVSLSNVDTGAVGEFSYAITYPLDAEIEITLQKWPEMNYISLIPNNLDEGNGITETMELEAGYYLLAIIVNKDEMYAGKNEAIHIYPSLLTVFTRDFDVTDLLAYTPITSAEISITAPVMNMVPDTTANGTGNFTISTVSWDPEHNTFLGSTEYTVTIILTANDRCTFSGLNSATINGQDAVATNNTSTTVTLSHTFPETDGRTVIDMEIKSQPTKLEYTHGDTLDLTGLVVTLTYNDTTAEDVIFEYFYSKNITPNPADGNHLVHLTHDGQPVTIIYGDLTTNTNNLNINPKVITFTVDEISDRTFTGTSQTPIVTVRDNMEILTLEADYTVGYTDNTNVGDVTVTITGMGNYAGSTGSREFTINPKVITFTVDEIPDLTFTGASQIPVVTVRDGTTDPATILNLDTDYTVEYTDNTNVGDVTVTVTGMGNYLGSTGSMTFTINPKIITFAVDTIPTQIYTGSAIQPIVTVNDGQTILEPNTDYTVMYANNTNAGTATVTITGTKNYAGSSGSTTFTIAINMPNSRLEYYWVDEHDSLVTTSGGAITVAAGEILTITAQDTGYNVKQWHLNGRDTSQNGNSYNFSSRAVGEHTVGLFVEKDGQLYNTNITITVMMPVITINDHPTSRTVPPGSISGNLYVEVTVTPNATLSYQWYSNTSNSNIGGTAISDATSPNYTIPTNLTVGTYYYFCEVSATGGATSVYSNVATVTVAPVITITTHPTSRIFEAGSIAGSLSVLATITPNATRSYQWYSNTSNSSTGGTAISGATSATYTIPTNLTVGTYHYFCEVSGTGATSVRSNVATITVITVTATLTTNTWIDGNITSSNGEQWFRFISTSGMQVIHFNFGTLTNIYIQPYTSSFVEIGTGYNWSISTHIAPYFYWNSLPVGQVYYVKVTPYTANGTGTFRIAFNTSATRPQ